MISFGQIFFFLNITFSPFSKHHIFRYFSVTRPLSYRARRTTKVAALMILSAWGLSTVIWVPTINAWRFIDKFKPNLDKDEMCYIEFVESDKFMSILCCMVAFYIPVSIMSGLYIRWVLLRCGHNLNLFHHGQSLVGDCETPKRPYTPPGNGKFWSFLLLLEI